MKMPLPPWIGGEQNSLTFVHSGVLSTTQDSTDWLNLPSRPSIGLSFRIIVLFTFSLHRSLSQCPAFPSPQTCERRHFPFPTATVQNVLTIFTLQLYTSEHLSTFHLKLSSTKPLDLEGDLYLIRSTHLLLLFANGDSTPERQNPTGGSRPT